MVELSLDLESLRSAFQGNPVIAHQRLREFRASNHPEFLRQALEILRAGEDNSFTHLLIQSLREDGRSLQQMLFDPAAMSVEEAANVVKLVSKSDPSFTVHFTAAIKTEIDKSGSEVRSEDLARLLEVLVLAVDANRLVPLLGHLCSHGDEKIRSKAVLLSGRVARSFPKGLALLKDLDPRVRANAVESLWGRRDEETLQLFREAAKDPHHRVAANAIYGLYVAGEISSIPQISRMVTGSEGLAQLAGIWLLQKSADPRFLPLIQGLLAVSTGRVKAGLLKAGRLIKQRREELAKLPYLDLDLLRFERKPNGRVRIALTVSDVDGQVLDSSEVLPTAIQIFDVNLRVDAFRTASLGAKELAILYEIPLRKDFTSTFAAQLLSAMELALSIKRPMDSWSVNRYNMDGGEPHSPNVPVDFLERTELVRSEQLRSQRCQFASLSGSFPQILLKFPSGNRLKHWVIIRDPELRETIAIPQEIVDRAVRFGISVHVIACSVLPAEEREQWDRLCGATAGYFVECESPAELPLMVKNISQGLQARFELTYELGRIGPPAEQAENVLIEVHSAHGIGRLAVDPKGHVVDPPDSPIRLEE